MPQVQIIEPTIKPQEQKIRVCAYARVSSDSDDQLNSFSAQVEYFTQLIQSHSDWEFVDIYADEGITGTRADKRNDFQRLMRDCQSGRIDCILVKSVSRFARNSTDCIKAVRELQALGISVIFEKEQINTGALTNEMFLSMMSAFAQEEAISISQNMRRGAVMRMKNGTFRLSQIPYGYRYDEHGVLTIQSEEAETVRWIYSSFLSGVGIQTIAQGGDSDFYAAKLRQLSEQKMGLTNQLQEIQKKKMADQAQEYQYQQALLYINNEENLNLTEFNDDFIRRIIEQVTVLSATQIRIRFVGGYEQDANLPLKK